MRERNGTEDDYEPWGARPCARNSHSSALFAEECQSFLDNVIAGLGQMKPSHIRPRRPNAGQRVAKTPPGSRIAKSTLIAGSELVRLQSHGSRGKV
jgi:hypothetical protein